MKLHIDDCYFGELIPFIEDSLITDITWNGRSLWVDHLEKGRYMVKTKLDSQFVNTFATRIGNLVNKNFNPSAPLLEAETEELRISIIHESVTSTGTSIAIRKTPAVRRLTENGMLESGYADKILLELLEVLIKGHCSVIVTGDVGSGKTELVKYLTKFIPENERAISIEDSFELRLAGINPGLDCVEMKASDSFDYTMCIKSSLRQLCKWLLLSESRSREVESLLEAASTGCVCLTTIHSDDVRKLPDRIQNMIGERGYEKTNDIYNFFDVGIRVRVDKNSEGIHRQIDQICTFDREGNSNSIRMIYEDGSFTGENLPENIRKKIARAGMKNPLDCLEVKS